jgi:hypothetical protein
MVENGRKAYNLMILIVDGGEETPENEFEEMETCGKVMILIPKKG